MEFNEVDDRHNLIFSAPLPSVFQGSSTTSWRFLLSNSALSPLAQTIFPQFVSIKKSIEKSLAKAGSNQRNDVTTLKLIKLDYSYEVVSLTNCCGLYGAFGVA